MEKWLKIIGLVVVAVPLIGFGTFIVVWSLLFARPMLTFDNSKIPYGLVTASPLEFDKIYSISKFRSEAGHDFSLGAWDGESCRSMKHYFNIDRGNPDNPNIRSLPTVEDPDVKIFAPFDGTIGIIDSRQLGKQVPIRSKYFPNFYVRFDHIYLLPGLHFGSQVKSGQQIGIIGPKDGADVSIEGLALFNGSVYLSAFEVMTDEAFAPYASAGYKRSDFIISREYRDAHPLKCGVGDKPLEFNYDANYDRHSDADFVDLKMDPFKHR